METDPITQGLMALAVARTHRGLAHDDLPLRRAWEDTIATLELLLPLARTGYAVQQAVTEDGVGRRALAAGIRSMWARKRFHDADAQAQAAARAVVALAAPSGDGAAKAHPIDLRGRTG